MDIETFRAWYSDQRRRAAETDQNATFKSTFDGVVFRFGYGSLKNGLSRSTDDFAPCPEREWHSEFNRNVGRNAYMIKTGARRRKLRDSLEYMRRCRFHAEPRA